MRSWVRLTLVLLALPSVLCSSYSDEEKNSESSYEKSYSSVPVLYKFGPAVKDHMTPVEDDGTSGKIQMRHSFKYFGEIYRDLFVNNNGAISFDAEVTKYTPDPFPIEDICIITPYWADSDNEIEGKVFYSERTDSETLERIEKDMAHYFPNLYFKPVWSFVATWYKMAYYGSESDKTNTFQAILTTDNHRSIVMFNYGDMQWTTGTASGGDPLTGLGGVPAQAGFNTKGNHFSIPGSQTDHILNVKTSSNVETPGRWIFQVDEFKMPGGCIFEASYMQFGQSVWRDDTCSTKCICKHDGTMDCDPMPCPENLICVPSGKHFMCQIDEEDC